MVAAQSYYSNHTAGANPRGCPADSSGSHRIHATTSRAEEESRRALIGNNQHYTICQNCHSQQSTAASSYPRFQCGQRQQHSQCCRALARSCHPAELLIATARCNTTSRRQWRWGVTDWAAQSCHVATGRLHTHTLNASTAATAQVAILGQQPHTSEHSADDVATCSTCVPAVHTRSRPGDCRCISCRH